MCASTTSIELESRADIPIAQNLIFRDATAARNCAVGQLEMRRCRQCGFVWNALFDSDLMRYDETYDNDQNFSGIFRSHVAAIAQRVAAAQPGKKEIALLEIGCGQGSFLSVLAEAFDRRMTSAAGFDPAWRGDATHLPANTTVVGDYFTAETADRIGKQSDVVVSRHTIEHVPDPIPFLATIRQTAKPGAEVFIETPDVDWILSNGVFFDFFYEHCSIFNPQSIAYAMKNVGFVDVAVESVFSGQYLLATAKVPLGQAASEPDLASAPFDDLGYRRRRDSYIAKFEAAIDSAAVARKPLALWGGASKGVTLSLVLPDAKDRIRCAIDINPRKQGGFLPGSGIPIVSPEQAASGGIKVAIVLNPNYAAEIESYCRSHGINFDLITI